MFFSRITHGTSQWPMKEILLSPLCEESESWGHQELVPRSQNDGRPWVLTRSDFRDFTNCGFHLLPNTPLYKVVSSYWPSE